VVVGSELSLPVFLEVVLVGERGDALSNVDFGRDREDIWKIEKSDSKGECLKGLIGTLSRYFRHELNSSLRVHLFLFEEQGHRGVVLA
jgi:hypothetical protein